MSSLPTIWCRSLALTFHYIRFPYLIYAYYYGYFISMRITSYYHHLFGVPYCFLSIISIPLSLSLLLFLISLRHAIIMLIYSLALFNRHFYISILFAFGYFFYLYYIRIIYFYCAAKNIKSQFFYITKCFI